MNGRNRSTDDGADLPRPHKGPWVADLVAGAEFVGFFVARNPRLVDFRDPGRGKYLRMQLYDRTGVIDAKLWNGAEELFDQVKGGGPVKVAGAVETFREELQVNVHRLRRALPEELDIADFVRVTGRDPAAMWETVMQAVKGIQDPHLAALVRHFYTDMKWASLIIEAPAARRIHHAYRSGFLEHVYELIILARPLLDLYPEIDRDLLYAGIMLHDIGKLEELDWGWDTDLTLEGHLVGHIVLGARRVARTIDAIDGFPKARAAELLHLVVSHHGRLEWGSPRQPKSIEAVALHHLDNLDAQVNRIKLLTETERTNGDPWTPYDRLLGRSLYSGNGAAAFPTDEGAAG
jgi:3'-5' exoribonuclease